MTDTFTSKLPGFPAGSSSLDSHPPSSLPAPPRRLRHQREEEDAHGTGTLTLAPGPTRTLEASSPAGQPARVRNVPSGLINIHAWLLRPPFIPGARERGASTGQEGLAQKGTLKDGTCSSRGARRPARPEGHTPGRPKVCWGQGWVQGRLGDKAFLDF